MDKLLCGQRCRKARKAFQLVDGPTGMPQSPAAHLGNRDAAGGDHRSQCQRSFVTDSTRTVFVYLNALYRRQVQQIPAPGHSHGQIIGLPFRHLLKINCHHQSRNLIVRNRSFCVPFHKEIDFFFAQFTAVSLFHDNIIHSHRLSSVVSLRSRFSHQKPSIPSYVKYTLSQIRWQAEASLHETAA